MFAVKGLATQHTRNPRPPAFATADVISFGRQVPKIRTLSGTHRRDQPTSSLGNQYGLSNDYGKELTSLDDGDFDPQGFC